MFKSISENSHKWIKANSKSNQTDNQLENYFGSYIFADEIKDESSEYSGESDENEINTKLLNFSFKIIPSKIDDNCLFLTLNNIVFGRQLTAKYIREEIFYFIIKKAIMWTSMRR